MLVLLDGPLRCAKLQWTPPKPAIINGLRGGQELVGRRWRMESGWTGGKRAGGQAKGGGRRIHLGSGWAICGRTTAATSRWTNQFLPSLHLHTHTHYQVTATHLSHNPRPLVCRASGLLPPSANARSHLHLVSIASFAYLNPPL